MADGNGTQHDIGFLKGKLENVEADVAELRSDVKQILAKVSEGRGVFKALGWAGTGLAAGAGALGGFFSKKFGL